MLGWTALKFKISVEWWYFFGADLVALIIAWLTVGTLAI
jgi:hypothetical protein